MALVAAILFAVLTLVASGPHHHDGVSDSGFFAACTRSLSAAAAPADTAPDSSVLRSAGPLHSPADCPLCDWLTVQFLISFSIAAAVMALSAPVLSVGSAAIVSRCSRRVPHRGLRAPPVRF